MAASLGFYVVLMSIIGFDVASVLFAGVAMFICGERRPVTLALYAVVVGGVLVWAFHAILPFPMYTLIL
jgi:hypothetical protein